MPCPVLRCLEDLMRPVSAVVMTELRFKHVEVFGVRTLSDHKDYLVKPIAWWNKSALARYVLVVLCCW